MKFYITTDEERDRLTNNTNQQIHWLVRSTCPYEVGMEQVRCGAKDHPHQSMYVTNDLSLVTCEDCKHSSILFPADTTTPIDWIVLVATVIILGVLIL